MKWNDPSKILPETEPNTDGQVCAVITEDGNVYRARYMHDVPNEGAEAKYWSEFTIDRRGRENEHYEISEKVILWTPLPSLNSTEGEEVFSVIREDREKQCHKDWYRTEDPISFKFFKALSPEYITDFYTSEKAWLAAKARAIPEGYVLLPKIPTSKMIQATDTFNQGMGSADMNLCYEAMIEASESGAEK